MEKEQLTLEMLCGYISTDLKFMEFPTKKILDFIGLRNDNFIYLYNEDFCGKKDNPLTTGIGNINHGSFKPIFHPLSELEGTEQWNEIVSEHNYPDFGHFERSVLSGHAPHKLIMELVKEHFWIYDQSYFEKKIILDYNDVNGL